MTTETDVALAFLRRVLPAEGPYSYRYHTGKTKNWMRKEFVDTIEALWSGMSSNMVSDVYYSTASFKDASSPEAANVFAKKAFYLDLDIGKKDGYADQTAAIRAVLEFAQSEELPPPGFIGSGNGVHAYWCLTDAVSCDVWQRYATGLKIACKEKGLRADGAVTADPARILRCPGTFNYKSSPPAEVFAHDLFFAPKLGPYDLDKFDGLLAYMPDRVGVSEATPTSHVEGSAVLNEQNMLYYGSMLDAIHNVDDREIWFKVGMAVYELGWGDVGYNMWTDWAKQSEKYNEEEQKKAWAGFPKYRETHLDNLVTPGTLAYYAKEAGWESGVDAPAPPPPSVTFVPPPELVAKAETDSEARYKLHCTEVLAAGPELSGGKNACFAKNSFPNARLGLVKLGVRGRLNMFTAKREIKMPGKEWEPLTDDLELTLSVKIMGVSDKTDPGAKATERALRELCYVGRHHPVREYLNSLRGWDGKSRLDTWLTDYLGASDTPLNRFYGATTLIAAVRRIMRDEYVPFDHMLVLEGPQGTGKSTAVQILGGGLAPKGWYKNQEINWTDSKSSMEVFEGCWFYEWSELAGHGKVTQNHIKRCLSSPADDGRRVYAHYTTSQRRNTILIGTTNSLYDYLTDQTGARRYWCVRTGDKMFKLDGLRKDRDQLFAEALVRDRAPDAPRYLDPPKELFAAEREIHEDRSKLPELYDALMFVGAQEGDCHHGETEEWIFTREIKDKYCPLEKQDLLLDLKISEAMDKHGWKRGRKYFGSVQARCFYRPIKRETNDV